MCEVVAAIRLSKRALLDVSRYTCSGVQRARGRERGTRGREREREVWKRKMRARGGGRGCAAATSHLCSISRRPQSIHRQGFFFLRITRHDEPHHSSISFSPKNRLVGLFYGLKIQLMTRNEPKGLWPPGLFKLQLFA